MENTVTEAQKAIVDLVEMHKAILVALENREGYRYYDLPLSKWSDTALQAMVVIGNLSDTRKVDAADIMKLHDETMAMLTLDEKAIAAVEADIAKRHFVNRMADARAAIGVYLAALKQQT